VEAVDRALAGDRRALARLITWVENRSPEAREALRLLYPHTGRARVVGVTGPPGTGKSTLVNQLAKEFRRRGQSVGIIAVDPSSPFTRGALLGDRVRMQELSQDQGVFIRSMATRGALGGLAETTAEVMAVLDAVGKDVVMVETVGAGQGECEVARLAQTTLVVEAPGGGDEIQVLKAGILEIADIYVVNKADKEEAEALAAELSRLLSFAPASGWQVPVLRTIAIQEMGIVPLVDAIEGHGAHLRVTGKLQADERERVRQQILALARQAILARLLEAAQADGRLEALVQAVARRELDPHTAAQRLVSLLKALEA